MAIKCLRVYVMSDHRLLAEILASHDMPQNLSTTAARQAI